MNSAQYKSLMNRLLIKFRGRCLYCGIQCRVTKIVPGKRQEPDKATIDHLTPKSMGGTNNFENLALACRDCNYERQTTPWLEFAVKKNYQRQEKAKFYASLWK